MSDNPFAEPGDDERTVILPAGAARTTAPPPPPPSGTGDFVELPALGTSPVLAAAAPVLALVARIGNVLSLPDPAALRDSAIAEMRRYEQTLRDLRLPAEQIRTAHYALCASLDDVVLNTPWGRSGAWADASLVSTFHQEVRSGDRFFELLGRLCQNAGRFLPVVELMYLCMAVGMQGRYRLSPRGPAELDRVREETYLVILRQRGPAERALSPHWQGVAAPFRPPRAQLPVWVAALLGAGVLGLLTALASFDLNARSDRLLEAGAGLPPAAMPRIARLAPPQKLPPPPPRPPGPREVLAERLRPEIASGQVGIAGTDALPILRLQGNGMFASGSATIEAAFLPVLARIAEVLKDRNGTLAVIGYTDDQPIRTVAFPSNFQLSAARARAAAAVLARTVPPARLSAEGRADADPIASNATAEGRQSNRRIEILLRPPAPGSGAS
ncbi:type VI secretion system protein TssL, long form [Rhodovastum atsumiense]|uniref:Type VI secretion system protein TssL n=1 Tax=Rhodovastum atsumiense TaxID=504468 RepID=A0A5M6IWM1_9PROT|nr:type VI secretion system protein TssL, long form [Rhodovastum atsumiense]KAA5612720.1 type VI secretion system protein TssL [Rhodovastum atsumiense]